MTNIINFPRRVKPDIGNAPKVALPKLETAGVGASVVKGLWVVTVLVWPILKWFLSIDCFFQFIRMIYHWDTPSVHAGVTFLAHFATLTALTYFVSVFKPKGL